jgi:HAMP domain-containing protein
MSHLSSKWKVALGSVHLRPRQAELEEIGDLANEVVTLLRGVGTEMITMMKDCQY